MNARTINRRSPSEIRADMWANGEAAGARLACLDRLGRNPNDDALLHGLMLDQARLAAEYSDLGGLRAALHEVWRGAIGLAHDARQEGNERLARSALELAEAVAGACDEFAALCAGEEAG